MIWTVTEFEPMRNFTWVARRAGLRFEAAHRIEGAGRQVRTTVEFGMTGALAWLGALLAGAQVRSFVDTESAGLKRAAETA